MEIKKKILTLYDYEEGEEKKEDKKNDDLSMFMEFGDENEKNKTFLNLKLRIKKIIHDLNEQENILSEMNEKLHDYTSKNADFGFKN